MVDRWHSSTAQDISVVVDGIPDLAHTSAHARQIEITMPVLVMTSEGVGDALGVAPLLAPPAYVPPPSTPASDHLSDADDTPPFLPQAWSRRPTFRPPVSACRAT